MIPNLKSVDGIDRDGNEIESTDYGDEGNEEDDFEGEEFEEEEGDDIEENEDDEDNEGNDDEEEDEGKTKKKTSH